MCHAALRGLPLFGVFLEFPLQVEHEVAGYAAVPGFGASLPVDGVGDVAQVVEQVEALQRGGEVALEEGA